MSVTSHDLDSHPIDQPVAGNYATDILTRNLTSEQIAEMGLFDADSDAAQKYPTCYPKHDRGIMIPYLNVDTPYARRRNSEPLPVNDKGEGVRYSSPVDANHLYWLPNDAAKIQSPKSVLLWTEGEFKTAALSFTARSMDMSARKYAPVGAGGVWNFQSAANFKEIPAADRDHVIFFDADAAANSDVRRAAYRLAALLVQRGASLKNIKAAIWNAEAGKGIDDYLQAQADAPAALTALIDAAQPVVNAYPLDLASAVHYLVVPGLEQQHISQLASALAAKYKADGVTKHDIRRMFKAELLALHRRAAKHDATPQPVMFWKTEFDALTGAAKVVIDMKQYLEFLADNGFGLLRVDDRLIFVRVQDKVVSENLIEHGENIDVKWFTMDYLRQQGEADVENAMLRGHAHYFAPAALNTLPLLSPTFLRDTKDTAFLFFKNGFLTVTKDSACLTPYAQMPCHIWKRQILSHEYCGAYADSAGRAELKGDMLTFFELITSRRVYESQPLGVENFKRDDAKLGAFLSAYGYLLHGYKDVTLARAVLCVDNSLGNIGDDGRTGKSIYCESLKYLKHVQTENGKTWDIDDRFAFQNVTLDTQVIFVDDIAPKFDFPALYPSITGDLSCECKNIKKMVIPFAESPKFALTSNNPVKGEGASDLARQWVLPFSRFFSIDYTPEMFFGRRLFADWQDADWQDFFDFAIYCISRFLRTGFIPATDAEFQRAKLLNALPDEVLSVFEGAGMADGGVFIREDLLRQLPRKFDTTGKSFTRYLKIFAAFYGLTYDETRSSRRVKDEYGSAELEMIRKITLSKT